MIRSNRLIKGITLKNKEIKISQLADDTTIILYDIRSVPEVNKELLIFFKCSGLKTNIDKTQAFMINKHCKFKEINIWTKMEYREHKLIRCTYH